MVHRKGTWVGFALALAVTGGVLAVYHRPGGRGFFAGTHPARTGLHVAIERLFVWGHRAAAGALVLALALWAWRSWQRRRWQPTTLPWGWAGVVTVALSTAFVVPWEAYLPWADAAAVTDLAPTRLSETEGPFSELVGLRAHYPHGVDDPAWPAELRSRRRVVLAWVHVLAGPLGLLAALFVSRVYRARQP